MTKRQLSTDCESQILASWTLKRLMSGSSSHGLNCRGSWNRGSWQMKPMLRCLFGSFHMPGLSQSSCFWLAFVAMQTSGELCMKQAFAPYWVCAYANNQWVLEDAISDNPRKTSFYKAMQLCHGVLLVLDSNATPFSRIWCCFEESIAVEHLVDDIIELYCISVLSPVITGYSGSCWIKTDIDIANIKGFTGEI